MKTFAIVCVILFLLFFAPEIDSENSQGTCTVKAFPRFSIGCESLKTRRFRESLFPTVYGKFFGFGVVEREGTKYCSPFFGCVKPDGESFFADLNSCLEVCDLILDPNAFKFPPIGSGSGPTTAPMLLPDSEEIARSRGGKQSSVKPHPGAERADLVLNHPHIHPPHPKSHLHPAHHSPSHHSLSPAHQREGREVPRTPGPIPCTSMLVKVDIGCSKNSTPEDIIFLGYAFVAGDCVQINGCVNNTEIYFHPTREECEISCHELPSPPSSSGSGGRGEGEKGSESGGIDSDHPHGIRKFTHGMKGLTPFSVGMFLMGVCLLVLLISGIFWWRNRSRAPAHRYFPVMNEEHSTDFSQTPLYSV